MAMLFAAAQQSLIPGYIVMAQHDMSGLCAFKDALGKPGEGLHSYRIGGLAAVDLLLTGIAAYFISRKASPLLGLGWAPTTILVFLVLVLIAIGVHRAFCVNTQLNAWIFGEEPKTTPDSATVIHN